MDRNAIATRTAQKPRPGGHRTLPLLRARSIEQVCICLSIAQVVLCFAVAGCGSDEYDFDADPLGSANPWPPGEAPDGSDHASAADGARSGRTVRSDAAATESENAAQPLGWSPTDGGLVVVREGGVVLQEADGTAVVCYQTTCAGRLLQCGDCLDNDGDGKTDWRDRECLGPCDNTEGPALIAGVGGVTGTTCHVDCYFDYGNGPGTGSDDCWWDHRCDPLEPEAPSCLYSETVRPPHNCPEVQSEKCTNICLPYTPNGCDCFGCCTFPELATSGPDGERGYVWIGAKDQAKRGMCTFDDVLDPDKCPPCTPVAGCLNECGPCEVCVGRPIPPPECFETRDGGTVTVDGGRVPTGGEDGPGQCPEGQMPCGLPGQAVCGPGYYCISGCCVAVIL